MRFIRHLHHDTRGNVLMLTGLAILILFAVAGAGVDFGRQQLVRMKLQNASDAAAVAAASMPDSVSADQRRAVALRYYNLNFPTTYLGIARPTPNIQVGNQIIVDASTSFDANFVSNVGVNRLESQGRTVVDRTAPQQTIYDVILVMDNSGSMSSTISAPAFSPSSNQQNARNTAIQKCYTEMQMRMRYQWCPYYIAVNRGIPMPDGTSRNYNAVNCPTTAWSDYCNRLGYGESNKSRGIVGTAVNNSQTRLSALRAIALNFVTRIMDEGTPGSRVATVTWASDLYGTEPLTTNAERIRERINSMYAWGGTNPFIAMNQATTLSSDFNPGHVKAVVFLSDGKPTQAGPFLPPNLRDSSTCNGDDYCTASANNTLTVCSRLKSQGIQVYTVGFLNSTDDEFVEEPGSYNRSVTFLRSCASTDAEGNPRYYTAQNGQQLDAAFSEILTSLGRIRIAQ